MQKTIKEKNRCLLLSRLALFLIPPAVLLLYEYIRLGQIGNMTSDARLYLSIADNFLKTGHFIQTARWFKGLVVPPVVPVFLLLFRSLGFTEGMIIGVQALLFGCTNLLLGETERKVFGGYRGAPVFYLLAYARCRLLLGNIMVEHFFLFQMCLLLRLVFSSLETGKKLLWMNIVGLLLLMTRPALAPVYLAIVAYTFVWTLKRKHFGLLTAVILVPTVCFSLNLLVNYRETGEIIPLESYSGTDLYITANPNAPVTVEEGLQFFDETRDEIFNDTALTMSEKSRQLNALAKEYIRQNTGEYTGKALLRCGVLFLKSYRYLTLIPLIGALLLIAEQKTRERKRMHLTLFGINLFLALMISFGIPEVRYTAVIWPLASIHSAAVTDRISVKINRRSETVS